MVVATPDFGLLYLFAIASLAVYGTALAGWASNNKFALLGGVRASSQMISYEVALGLSLVGIMLAFSSVQLPAIVGLTLSGAQSGGRPRGPGALPVAVDGRRRQGFDFGLPAWGIILQPVGFIGFFAAAFAETKRAPFDVPEGESEIIGYFVEYSGMQFGLFMISEFVEVVVLSGVDRRRSSSAATTCPSAASGWQPQLQDHAAGVRHAAGHLLLDQGAAARATCSCSSAGRSPASATIRSRRWAGRCCCPWAWRTCSSAARWCCGIRSLRYLALFGLLQIGVLVALTLSRRRSHEEHGHGHGALGHGGMTPRAARRRPRPRAAGSRPRRVHPGRPRPAHGAHRTSTH